MTKKIYIKTISKSQKNQKSEQMGRNSKRIYSFQKIFICFEKHKQDLAHLTLSYPTVHCTEVHCTARPFTAL